jgi:hypothetical protein
MKFFSYGETPTVGHGQLIFEASRSEYTLLCEIDQSGPENCTREKATFTSR